MTAFESLPKVWATAEIIRVLGGKLLMVKSPSTPLVPDPTTIPLESVTVKIAPLIGKPVATLRTRPVIDAGLGVSKIFNSFV